MQELAINSESCSSDLSFHILNDENSLFAAGEAAFP